jgi:signal transduction histidine kinase
MSSLGQLIAGIAHEINNPVNFIYGNLTYVNEYTQQLLGLINLYEQHDAHNHPEIEVLIKNIELEFIREDLPKMLSSMKVGAERIRQIVLTLRNFSRLDEAEMKPVNIHDGIDSTILILQSRLKPKPDCPPIQIIQEYGDLPKIECYASQLNQVFMNLLSNAIDGLNYYDKKRSLEQIKKDPSTITIRTSMLNDDWIRISVKDNGLGITSEVRTHLFSPFFTTKPVGQGTGLGLSISYQIVVDKHGGDLRCLSQPDRGAEFVIEIPIRQRAQVKREAT